ncbi:MAG: arsenate reductase ArsC [Candidatus Omnitrophica bacterium]|nr:arsenate reductase ArsC [Candidatus Omnitrophota bacterium]
MKRVLFVCIHNSARSQMAEAYLNHFGENHFLAESAGIEPGQLNPVVVEAMREDGIDISANSTHSVQQFIEEGREYDVLVTVCDETSAERCPRYPGIGKRLHFGFEDPSAMTGEVSEKLARTRKIRDQIKSKIQEFIREQS